MKPENETHSCCSVCSAVEGSCDHLFTIDDRQVCNRCLFGEVSPVSIYPIGVVKNSFSRDESDFGKAGKGTTSRIELFPAQEQFMYRLGDESRLTIVYYLHQARPVKTIFNRGIDGKRVGVFASRTPDRLSGIGIQDVTLVEITGAALTVKGLDAVNGTPVLDIKLKTG